MKKPVTRDPTIENLGGTYERVSKFVQSFGYSLVTQTRTVDQVAAERGITIDPELRFRDGDVSDASGADWDLVDLNRMLDAAKAGKFRWLLVPDDSRFARNMTKSLVLEDLLRGYGVEVIYANMNGIDGETAEGKMMRNQLHVFSEYDRDKRAILTKRTRRAKAQSNTTVGNGAAPYGYSYIRRRPDPSAKERTLGMAIVESEAEVVREIYSRAVTQAGSKILRYLLAEGFISPGQLRGIKGAAATWTATTIYSILSSTLYKGSQVYAGYTIDVPPIVTPAEWQRTADAMAARYRKGGVHADREHVDNDPWTLRGLLVCGVCKDHAGEPLRLRCEVWIDKRNGGARTRYYRCPNLYAARREVGGTGVLVGAHCPVQGITAYLVENRLWASLEHGLLNDEAFEQALMRSRGRHDELSVRLDERIDAIEALIARQKKAITRAVGRINALDPEDAGDASEIEVQERTRDEAKRLVTKAQRDLDMARATRMPEGITAEDEVTLRLLVDELRGAFADASPAARRQVIERLRLVGTFSPSGSERGEPWRVQTKGKRQTAQAVWSGEIVPCGSTGSMNMLRIELRATGLRFAR